MAAAEQNGIDILCDAAGSDMLLSSLFALAAPPQEQQQQQRAQPPQQHRQHELQHVLPPASPSKQTTQHSVYQQQLDPALQQQQPSQQEHPPVLSSSLPAKRKLSDASASSPSHVCHICRRVYERADHLTRHLRSHENARPYQCSRCPKRFNRADLLTRHETTHDRDGAAKDRPFIRRSDRAAEACLNCAASKAKCEDQKPCSRCRSKSLTCQMPARRGNQYRTSESQAGMSPPESSMIASTAGNDSHVFTAGDAAYVLSQPAATHQGQSVDSAAGYTGSSFLDAPSVDGTPDDSLCFTPARKLFPDIEFSWDVDLSGFAIPASDVNGQTPQGGGVAKRSSRQARRDAAQEDALLWRSAWVDEHDTNAQTEASTLGFGKIPSFIRDRLFALVVANNPTPHRVPVFPSIDLLNFLVETYFAQDDQKRDAFIHKASFDPSVASSELLSAIISSGASHISTPAVWQFGLALDEVVRAAVATQLESVDSLGQDLMLLQASMLHLDIGRWCGSSRQMEMTDTFTIHLLAMLRKTGRTRFSSDANLYMPTASDSFEAIESKWRHFIMLESHKRSIIRLYLHEVQSSIGSWMSPAITYNELDFALPAARDLWKASGSQEWLEAHMAKSPPSSGVPRLSDVRDCASFVSDSNNWIDAELCCITALHGLWSQIWTYRDVARYYNGGISDRRSPDPPAWIKALYQETYSGLLNISKQAQERGISSPEFSVLSELFMMILHVSLDDLQRLAGKNGDEESRRAMQFLETAWSQLPEARYATWHAGQLLRHAQDCKLTALRGFNAMAVYFAGLTLWAYSVSSSPRVANDHQGILDDFVPLNGQETRESRAFLELGQGTAALIFPGGLRPQMEPLSNHGAALSLVRNIFRRNFPATNEPMPPIVESLCRHLLDLQSPMVN